MDSMPFVFSAYIKAFLLTLPVLLLCLPGKTKNSGDFSGVRIRLLRFYQSGFVLVFIFLLLPLQFKLLPYIPEITKSAVPESISLPLTYPEIPQALTVPGPVLPDTPVMTGRITGSINWAALWPLLFVPGIFWHAVQQFRKSCYLHKLEKSGTVSFFGKMRINCSPDAGTAFSCGIFRKKIYIPWSYKTPEDYRIAVIHEGHHHRNHDPLWLDINYLIACLFWFNPVHLFVYSRAKKCHEFACDN